MLDTLKQKLKIDVGETTPDRQFTLEVARCFGACGLAPVMMIDDKVYGALTPKKAVEVLATYRK